MKPTSRLLLIDGDTLIYAAACRSEEATDWGDGTWGLTANLDEAKSRFTSDIKKILTRGGASDFRIALSDYDNPRWREGILDSYKQNRVQRKPLVYEPLRLWVADHPKALTWPNLEGDDVLGILMTQPDFFPEGEKVCVSIDKDMAQIPGLHINYQNARDVETWKPVRISEVEGDRFHAYQTLTGDSIDGYKGCPGVGPKRAESALATGTTLEDFWRIVRAQYHMKGLVNGEMIQQARVARILRHTDFNWQTKEVIPWSPPLDD